MALTLLTLLLALLSHSSAPAHASRQASTATEQSATTRQNVDPIAKGPEPSPWADWIEPGFPFFSSVLDARHAGSGFPANNLTPRALVLRVGPGHWAAFDVDLLRVSAIWRGRAVTPGALAPGSNNRPDRKTPGGQASLPEPDGKVWLANGIYPGWQAGERPSFDDPREPAPSPEEVGRGPLLEAHGRFKAIRQVRDGVVLEYAAAGADVREWMTVSEQDTEWTFVRHFLVGPSSHQLWLVLGSKPADVRVGLKALGTAPLSLETVPAAGDTS